MAKKNIGNGKDELLQVLPAACADEKTAVELLELLRWGDEPCCPRCGDLNVRKMLDREGNRNARYLWRCKGCKKQFTVRIGTIFEESPIQLRIWLHAFWRMCASKKGVSALQLQRETGLGSYRSALFLTHRIRHAMATDPDDDPKLSGTVEIDETYVGGKPRFPRSLKDRKRGFSNRRLKAPVLAMVERGGRVRARHIERVAHQHLAPAIMQLVDRSSTVYTDEAVYYKWLDRQRVFEKHDHVTHSAKEYVRGDVHTNTVESFFALIKRGVYGTFHSVSKHHLHRYLSEFEFRYNTRKMRDGERTVAAIRGAEGKRLRYSA